MIEKWTDGVFEIEVDVAGRVECQGREWEVGWTLARNNHYLRVFRDVEQSENYFVLAARVWTEGVKICPEPIYALEKSSLAMARATLEVALELGAWGRVLWFDGQLRPCASQIQATWELFLLPDGRSAWGPVFSQNIQEASRPFERGEETPSLGSAPMQEWFDWTLRCLEEPTDCRFALDFARMNERARIELVMEWSNGDLETFERLCRSSGQLLIDWNTEWDGQKILVAIALVEDEHVNSNPNHFCAMSDSLKSFPTLPDLTDADDAWRRILSVTRPQARLSLLERKCVENWIRHQLPCVEFWVAPPDAHERIEALVSLREWARKVGIEPEMQKMLNLDDD